MSRSTLSLLITGATFVTILVRGPQWARLWLLTALAAILAVGGIALLLAFVF